MLRSMIAFIASILATVSLAGPQPSLPVEDLSRVVYIRGVIAGDTLVPLGKRLLEKAHEKPSAPVTIVINSPGGSVVSGFAFVSYMDAVHSLGTPINCYVNHLAASMAFQILLHCDNRYTLDRAFLLWHRVRMNVGGGIVTAPILEQGARALHRTDDFILDELRTALKLPETVLMQHFEDETLHIGKQLAELAPKFISSYKSIPLLLEVDQAKKGTILTSDPPPMFWNMLSLPGTVVYLCDRLIEVVGAGQ